MRSVSNGKAKARQRQRSQPIGLRGTRVRESRAPDGTRLSQPVPQRALPLCESHIVPVAAAMPSTLTALPQALTGMLTGTRT